MIKKTVIFVGPSLTSDDKSQFGDYFFRAPIEEGDVIRLLEKGVDRIGIIDGYFGDRRAVSHKEILFALSKGVSVYGASSMGALRAAELDSYGMIGVGEVYRAYRSGKRSNDGDVAVAHGPAELGYLPTSVPLVEVDATLAALVERRRLSRHTADQLREIAAAQYFGTRTWDTIAEVGFTSVDETEAMVDMFKTSTVEVKRLDALKLLAQIAKKEVANQIGSCSVPPFTFSFRNDLNNARKP